MLGCRSAALIAALLVCVAVPAQAAAPPDAAEDQPRVPQLPADLAPKGEHLASLESPPPTGRTMMGFGIFGIVLGALNLSGGVAIHAIGLGEATFIGSIEVGLGVGIMTLGAIGTHYGNRRRLEHRAWERRTGLDLEQWRRLHPDRGPAPGLGLVIGGSFLTASGITLSSYAATRWDIAYERKWLTFHIASGVFMLAGGAAMMGVGGKSVHRHRREHRMAWVPSPWIGTHEVGLSISGRF
jgi:hypothetical protein